MLNLPFLEPYALGISIFVVVFEVVLRSFLTHWLQTKIHSLEFVGNDCVFHLFNFYSAYFDKVKDCGCFGDALPLTPWESFTKDVVLLILILILFFGVKHIKPIFRKLGLTVVAY